MSFDALTRGRSMFWLGLSSGSLAVTRATTWPAVSMSITS